MYNKKSQSILDNLINLLPQKYRDHYLIKDKDYVEPSVAKNLYSIWRNGSQNSDKRVYKRPDTIAHNDLEQMKKAGLIRVIGENIEITEKGAKVISIMVLGDDRSSFENNDLIIDYNQALNKTKGLKTANKNKFIK